MKLFLSILSLVVAATFAVSAAETGIVDVQRQLQSETDWPAGLSTLEEQWFVEDPELFYNANTKVFRLETNLGWSAIKTGNRRWSRTYSYEFFDDCPDGNAAYNGAELIAVFESDFGYFRRGRRYIEFETGIADFSTLQNGGTANPHLLRSFLGFAIIPGIQGEDVYTEEGGEGIVKMCLRVGSWDFPEEGEPSLVNFKQLQLTVTYDLTDEFEVAGFATEVLESTTSDQEDSFSVVASLCTDSLNSPPFNPGNEVCIQVCPTVADDAFVDVASIDALDMSVSLPTDLTGTTMAIVTAGEAQLNTALDPVCDVDACCRVTFLLDAVFFPVGSVTTDQATVIGAGSATVTQFDNARRILKTTKVATRALQASEGEAEFGTEFPIQLEVPEESAAATLTSAAAAAAGAIGAALLL